MARKRHRVRGASTERSSVQGSWEYLPLFSRLRPCPVESECANISSRLGELPLPEAHEKVCELAEAHLLKSAERA